MAFPNRYRSQCCECGGMVPAGAGFAFKQGGKWVVQHKQSECVERVESPAVQLDQFQSAVRDSIKLGASGPHLVVVARAGSGKTFVQCLSFSELYTACPDLRLAIMAFGNEDGQRINARLPSGVAGQTLHSFGNGIIKAAYGRVKMNKQKLDDLISVAVTNDDYAFMTRELVSKAKADAIVPGDLAGLREVIKGYELPISGDAIATVVKFADRVLHLGMDLKKYGYDFDDMVYLPAVLDLSFPSLDVVGIDESQDCCESQILMIEKLVRAGSRIVIVGDPNQALYLFRGARHNCMERIETMLRASSRPVESLPMPISYRSSLSIIRLAQTLVPDIQARPGAPLGSTVFGLPFSDMLSNIRPGDMIACRTNAPLVRLAWSFALSGRRFYMRGGDREANMLCWLVRMLANQYGPKTDSIAEVVARAERWLEERRLTSSPYRLEEHEGRVEVIMLIASKHTTVDDTLKEIRKLFREPADKTNTIILSTIHRAKGSEATRVFHIHPELCPHPRATTEEQKAQEVNAQYVVYTRGILDYIEVKTPTQVEAAAA